LTALCSQASTVLVINIGMRREERRHLRRLETEKAKELEMEEMKKLMKTDEKEC
jgi:hypothetical protein